MYNKSYYDKNKEKLNDRMSQYYFDNKEERAEYYKDYYSKNKGKILAQINRWKGAHPKHIKDYNKDYYVKNKEKIDARRKLKKETIKNASKASE